MKHDEAPYRRWDPKPAWLAVDFHPPEKHTFLTVKYFENGEPFKAKLGSDGHWRDETGMVIGSGYGFYWLKA